MIIKKASLLIGLFLIIAFIMLYTLGIGNYVKIDYLKNHQETMQRFIHNHYLYAGLMYIIAYASMIIIMIPGGIPFTVMGGFLFGMIGGTIFSLLGALVGCALSFLGFKYLLYNWVQRQFGNEINNSMEHIKKNGVRYILSLQLVPITPYAFITALAALAGIPLGTFMLTTAIGALPSIILSAYAGSKLASLKEGDPVFSKLTISLLSLLALLALLPTFISWIKSKKKR